MCKHLLVLLPLLAAGCIAREHIERIEPSDPVEPAWTAEAAGVVADTDVVSRIDSQGVLRRVEADEIIRLKQAGVSDTVVLALIRAEVTVPREGSERRTVTYSPDWETIGDIAFGTLYLLGELGRIVIECGRCFCR